MDMKQVGALISSAREATREVDRQLRAIVQLDVTADPSHFDEENDASHDQLALLVERAVRRLRIGYSVLSLAPLLADFDAAVGHCGDPKAIDYFAQDTEYPFSPLNELIKERLADLQPLICSESPASAERRVASRIVHQIAHVMAKRGVVPTKEHDVQSELHLALLAAFPDVVREPSVAQQTKVYKPDFGIASIATAIEAKFLDDPKDVGTILGGIYEDMKGYAGSEWEAFLAVIYQTGAHVTQAVVNAEAQKVGTPKAWRIELVTGASASRPPKAPKPLNGPTAKKVKLGGPA